MSRLSKVFRSTTTRPVTARKSRLGIESLEAREVPSATLSNEILTVRGTTGNDTIEILSPQANQTIVRVNGVEQFSGSDTIQKIVVDGRTGTDNLLIRGLQSGIVDGANASNIESATVGEQDPVTAKTSTANVRSNLFIDNVNTLTIDNSAATGNANVVVSATAVTGIAPARIGFTFDSPSDSLTVQSGSGNDTFTMNTSQVGTTTLNGLTGTDTFNIEGTSGAVRVNGGAGADTINIAPTGHSLDTINGKVSVTDGAFQDKVVVTDQQAGASASLLSGYTASLSSTQISRAAIEQTRFGPLNFTKTDSDTIALFRVGAVNFSGATRSAPNAFIGLQSSGLLQSTTIDAGGSAVRLGTVGRSLEAIDGPVTITGGAASRLTFDDAGVLAGQRFTFDADTVRRGGMGTISVGGFAGPINVLAGAGADTFNVTAPRTGGRPLSVDGNGGTDILISPAGGSNWKILGQNQGTLNNSTTFIDTDSLDGSAASDTFRFANGAGVSGRIDGGGGFDTLDYEDFTTPVTVNLGAGTATKVSGGITRILNVFGGSAGDTLTGSSGNNVLLGNGGIDRLNGGSGGRDILVGGFGGDSLTTAGTGDTIYIGGNLPTADQNNVFSAFRIMAEWNGTNNYATRVANLQNGTGATGGVKLNATTMENDLATDAYTPGTGQDVFFVESLDTFSAGHLPAANEQVINV